MRLHFSRKVGARDVEPGDQINVESGRLVVHAVTRTIDGVEITGMPVSRSEGRKVIHRAKADEEVTVIAPEAVVDSLTVDLLGVIEDWAARDARSNADPSVAIEPYESADRVLHVLFKDDWSLAIEVRAPGEVPKAVPAHKPAAGTSAPVGAAPEPPATT